MKKNSMMRILQAGFMTALLAAGMMLPAAAGETEKADASKAETISIGQKDSDEDYEVTLINESGKEIGEIALRAAYEEYSDNLLPEKVTMKDQEQGTLWCKPAEMINFVPPVYDIRLTFTDDSEAVLHTLPFGDADTLTVKTDEASGIVYVSFHSLSLDADTDSLQAEKNIAQSGEDGMIADYLARTGQTSSQDAAAADDGSAQSAPVQEAPAPAPAPAPEQCLDDGLMF